MSNSDNSIITINNEPVSDKKVLLVGDSFRMNLIHYISKYYSKVVYVHRDYYQNNIDDDDFDIVILESVERYAYLLENFEF